MSVSVEIVEQVRERLHSMEASGREIPFGLSAATVRALLAAIDDARSSCAVCHGEIEQVRGELKAEREKPRTPPKELVDELAALRKQDRERREAIELLQQELRSANKAHASALDERDAANETVKSMARWIASQNE